MAEPLAVTIDYPDFFDSTLVTPLGEGRFRLELTTLAWPSPTGARSSS